MQFRILSRSWGRPPPRPPTTAQTRRLRILVVDSEVVVRNAVARILDRMDCEVALADGGREALQHFVAAPGQFDVVLRGVPMLYLSGADALRGRGRLSTTQKASMMSGFVSRDENATTSADCLPRKPCICQELEALLASPRRLEPSRVTR